MCGDYSRRLQSIFWNMERYFKMLLSAFFRKVMLVSYPLFHAIQNLLIGSLCCLELSHAI
ncbi:hypothetical protein APHHGE2_1129 [Anaplasma phagocytophilum str. HGE2]|nr:hypothetical protein APHWEB_1183 [Anaplasma phagocytophilum str. Webster]KJV83269.1 hypothetical protein APHHGE2_1129 [Anaplasma phagocytophilum str. HGE2]